MSSVFAGALPITARNLGHRGVAVFSIISLVVAFLSSALIWIDLYIGSSPVWLDLFGAWFEIGTVTVSWVFYYDLLTAHMLFTVTSVSLAVHIYAVVYMRTDPHLTLFMSYLSLFTFFMLVYVCGDNLLVMLVGWEGITKCLIGFEDDFIVYAWYLPGVSGERRKGPHSNLFKQIMIGALLGDGWLEKHGAGARFGISFKHTYKDVANWYQLMFYILGYHHKMDVKEPLSRILITGKLSNYYQVRTFSFESLLKYYYKWYIKVNGRSQKVVPRDIEKHFTPLVLALWFMGDGSGMRDGGFKIATHSFTLEDNMFLIELLYIKYGIKASIHKDGNKVNIYIWKRSVPRLKSIVLPFFQESCLYKWRHVKQ